MNDPRIAWKTNAWRDPGMVAGYARAMELQTGGTLMKNRIETALFQKFARGSNVLDVGVGTGRASLPLARAGKNVTGVDSSQAMLEKCRELAGGTPMRLLIGDVAALPFANASFDTVMGLNTLAHFPNWKEIMCEWRRVARPGADVLFDVHSLDHDIAFARATGHDEAYAEDHFAAKDVKSFHLRLRARELVNYASKIGLKVRAIVPYGALFGSAGVHRFLERSLLDGHSWDRLLSWVGEDRKLFEFFVFIEEELVARMPTCATGRFFAAFDVAGEGADNKAWQEKDREVEAQFASGPSLAFFEQAGADTAMLRRRLNEYLLHEPNRFAFARMLLANRTWKWDIHLEEWIEPQYQAELQHIQTLGALNDVSLELLRSLSSSAPIAQAFDYKGLPLQQILAYDMMRAVLDEGCNAFAASFAEGN